MDQNTLIALFVVLVIAVGVILWLVMRQRRTAHLRDKFGDEYDRTVDTAGDRAEAERNLEKREERVDALDIRRLTANEHDRFRTEWQDVKATFVDSPVEAVLHADRMLGTMMKTVGYPMADFDRRYEDLTVNHADVARHYREGHNIADRHNSGDASTEDMRQAMKHYEALYDHLTKDAGLGDQTDTTTTTTRDGVGTTATTTDTSTGVTTKATDLDGDGDADVVRRDVDGDGSSDRYRVVADR